MKSAPKLYLNKVQPFALLVKVSRKCPTLKAGFYIFGGEPVGPRTNRGILKSTALYVVTSGGHKIVDRIYCKIIK